jgi:hypothetical protein
VATQTTATGHHHGEFQAAFLLDRLDQNETTRSCAYVAVTPEVSEQLRVGNVRFFSKKNPTFFLKKIASKKVPNWKINVWFFRQAQTSQAARQGDAVSKHLGQAKFKG